MGVVFLLNWVRSLYCCIRRRAGRPGGLAVSLEFYVLYSVDVTGFNSPRVWSNFIYRKTLVTAESV